VSQPGARQLLESHLWADEQLVWCDQPLASGPVAKAAARRGFYASFGVAAGVLGFFVIARRVLIQITGGTDEVVLGVGVLAALAVLGFGALSKWSRARVLAHLTAYGITNRRVIMIRGEEEEWVGLRELERSEVRGEDVVVMRGKTASEHLWASQGENRHVMARADVVNRELVLAAVPNPQHVAGIIQTLLRPSAS
jgi:hypothetical protein